MVTPLHLPFVSSSKVILESEELSKVDNFLFSALNFKRQQNFPKIPEPNVVVCSMLSPVVVQSAQNANQSISTGSSS